MRFKTPGAGGAAPSNSPSVFGQGDAPGSAEGHARVDPSTPGTTREHRLAGAQSAPSLNPAEHGGPNSRAPSSNKFSAPRSNTWLEGDGQQNRRRGSYVSVCSPDAVQDTSRLADKFTMKRTMSVRPTASIPGIDPMNPDMSGWSAGNSSKPGSPHHKPDHRNAPELLSATQVDQYHKLLEGISHIKGLHDCVDHPCGNIYWDFRMNRCMPGRVWVDKMPPDVKAQVDRDFTSEEVGACEQSCNLYGAPRNDSENVSRALFIIGPAAAGKSTVRAKTEDLMQIKLSDYVEIDGDEFRNNHAGWMSVLKNDRTRGYKDALNVLLPYTRKLKKRIREEALQDRKHLIIPSTASDFSKLEREVESVREQGYRVDVIGLVVSYREARARALNRAHENGRWNDGTMKKWESAMKGIIWAMNPEISDMCVIFDNQNFNEPTPIYTRTFAPNFVELVVEKYRDQDKEFADQVAANRAKNDKKKKEGEEGKKEAAPDEAAANGKANKSAET